MKIQIKGDGEITSVKVNGIEMGGFVSSLKLEQEAGCVAELKLTIPVRGDVDIEIPHGATVIEKELQK